MLRVLVRNTEECYNTLFDFASYDYGCLSQYRRIGPYHFNLAETMKMAMLLRYVWILLSRGLVRRTLRFSGITRGRRTWHKTQCARRTRSTPTCDPPFCGSLLFWGGYLVLRVRVFEQCNIPPIRVLHISLCTEEGGCFSPCSVQSTIKSSFCG